MSVDAVKAAIAAIPANAPVTKDTVVSVFESAKNISPEEEAVLRSFRDDFKGQMDLGTKRFINQLLGELPVVREDIAAINKRVKSQASGLMRQMTTRMEEGAATKTFAGTPIPGDVKTVVR